MSYGLDLGWGTYRGLYRVLGGPIKGYTTNLVQGSDELRVLGLSCCQLRVQDSTLQVEDSM